jgi:hypothetical protein
MNGSHQRRPNHVQVLQEALDLLASAERDGSPEGQFDAHLELFGAFAELAMVPEAADELAVAAQSPVLSGDPVRVAALNARSATLALMRGEYDHAEQLLRADPAALWFQSFLLRRDRDALGDADLEELHASIGDEPRPPRLVAAAIAVARHDLGQETAQADSSEPGPDGPVRLLVVALQAEAGPLVATSPADSYVELLPYAGSVAIAPELGSVGPVDRYLGLISARDGRLDDARSHLLDALTVAERAGMRPWATRVQVDLAAVLLRRNLQDDAERARAYLATAESTARDLGMVGLEKAARSLAVGPRSDATSTAVKANVFRREGEFWAIAFAGTSFSLRDSKGLLYIARLLTVPDTEIHALDLVSGLKAEGGAVATQQANVAAAEGLTSDPFGAAGEVLDQAAREEYRQRLADIDGEIAEADSWNDSERAVRLQVERDFLIQELANATGLGGRARNASSASERARISVTKATWAAIDRISAHGPELGRHLSISIHTGTFCSYTPDPALKIVWEL